METENTDTQQPVAETLNHEADNTPVAESEAIKEAVEQFTEPRKYGRRAVVALILTLAAWVAAIFSGWATVCLCIAAIIFAATSLKSHRHIVRNTAITCIIASGVLLLVVGIFMVALYMLLN